MNVDLERELLPLMRSIYFRDFFPAWISLVLELSHEDVSVPGQVLHYIIDHGFDLEWPAHAKELAQVQCLEELLRHYLIQNQLIVDLLGFLLCMVRRGSMRPMIEHAMIIRILCGQLNSHTFDHHFDGFNFEPAMRLLIELSSHLFLHRRSELPPRIEAALISYLGGWEYEWDAVNTGEAWLQVKMLLRDDSTIRLTDTDDPFYRLGYAGKDPRQVVAMANQRLRLSTTQSTQCNTSTFLDTPYSEDDDLGLSSLCLDRSNQ